VIVLGVDGVALVFGDFTPTSGVTSYVTTTSEGTPGPGVIVIIPYFVGQGYGNFEPANITVVVGVNNTITWINQDQTAQHDIYFSPLPAGAFIPNNPSPPIGYAHAYTVTLTVPGLYEYGCEYHFWMDGSIQVLA